jgi:dihydrodipicolinate synthase/N-acetylneuraminate lyase
MGLLAAVKRGDRAAIEKLSLPFRDFDAVRGLYSAIPVVHAALSLAGIAETGPMGPFFDTDFDEAARSHITRVAKELLQADADFAAGGAG